MNIKVLKNRDEIGRMAAHDAAEIIRNTTREKGVANIILATGTSQFEVLKHLAGRSDIDWSAVVLFHLDEYLDIPEDHPASFRGYLKQRFIEKVGTLKEVNLINGQNRDVLSECKRLGEIIAKVTIDLALVGIGENGHIAFNDPPADFKTEEPFIQVTLDLKCRQQQLGEGWFKTLEEVPDRAITMSVRQILKSKHILCSVPDKRKALAVKNCLEQEESSLYPASALQNHPRCNLYLDHDSASLLTRSRY